MKFYYPGKRQGATQIGVYFAPLKTIGPFQKRTAVTKEDARKSNSFLRGVVVCVVATKGGSTMNDYMKSLQKHFDRQEHNELDERIRCVREELRQDLGTESRRRLLHLLDAQNTLLVDSTLMSFTAGFKLAWGIATELEADGLYSFEKEDEEPISEVNTHG